MDASMNPVTKRDVESQLAQFSGGTCVLNGLPPGEFPISIFDVVLNRYTVRGSIVGTRMDLEEALTFAAEGKVKATIETQPLESINDVFARLKTGKVNGRIVLDIAEQACLGGFKPSGVEPFSFSGQRPPPSTQSPEPEPCS